MVLLLNLLHNCEIDRYVQISTDEVYGSLEESSKPLRELLSNELLREELLGEERVVVKLDSDLLKANNEHFETPEILRQFIALSQI